MMSRRSRPSGRCCLGPDAPSRWSWCSGHSEYIWCRISWGTQQTNCEPSDQLLLIKAESGLKLLQHANSAFNSGSAEVCSIGANQDHHPKHPTCFINTVHHVYECTLLFILQSLNPQCRLENIKIKFLTLRLNLLYFPLNVIAFKIVYFSCFQWNFLKT